jgi:hypothetical protein
MYDCANIGSPFIVFAGGFGGIAYSPSTTSSPEARE